MIGDRERAWAKWMLKWAPPNPERYRNAFFAGYEAGKRDLIRDHIGLLSGIAAALFAIGIFLLVTL